MFVNWFHDPSSKSFEDWAKKHAFAVTRTGRLAQRRAAEPEFMANPARVIPSRWTRAQVMRTARGQVKIKLPAKFRNPILDAPFGPRMIRGPKYRVVRSAGREEWGAGRSGKAWIIIDSRGRMVGGFYKTKAIAEARRRRDWE